MLHQERGGALAGARRGSAGASALVGQVPPIRAGDMATGTRRPGELIGEQEHQRQVNHQCGGAPGRGARHQFCPFLPGLFGLFLLLFLPKLS